MYLLHGLAGPLHRHERLLVDVRRLDRVHLLLDGADVAQRLLEVVLVELLAPKRRLCSCRSDPTSASQSRSGSTRAPADRHTRLIRVDVLPRDLLLLLYLAREIGLALLQHLQLRP